MESYFLNIKTNKVHYVSEEKRVVMQGYIIIPKTIKSILLWKK